MKHLLSNLIGATVSGLDHPAGTVKDFYFDDHHWVIRYLVCKLRPSSATHAVLIPSGRFLTREWDLPVFPVDLTAEQIEDCPDENSDRPVSKQKGVLGGGVIVWPDVGAIGLPGYFFPPALTMNRPSGAPNLRSYRVVSKYRIDSSRGVLGKVVDFVVDDKTWAINSLIVQHGKLFNRKKIMVSPQWADEIDWAEGAIWTSTPPIEWANAPEFSPHL